MTDTPPETEPGFSRISNVHDQNHKSCYIEENDIVFFDTNFVSPKAVKALHPLSNFIDDLRNLWKVTEARIYTSDIVMMEYNRQLTHKEEAAIKQSFLSLEKAFYLNGSVDLNRLREFIRSIAKNEPEFRNVSETTDKNFNKVKAWYTTSKFPLFTGDSVKKNFLDGLILQGALVVMREIKPSQGFHFLSSDKELYASFIEALQEEKTLPEKITVWIHKEEENTDKKKKEEFDDKIKKLLETIGNKVTICPWKDEKEKKTKEHKKNLEWLLNQLDKTENKSSEGEEKKNETGDNTTKPKSDAELVYKLSPYMDQKKYWNFLLNNIITEEHEKAFQSLRSPAKETQDTKNSAQKKALDLNEREVAPAPEEKDLGSDPNKILKDFCTIVKNDDNAIVRTGYLLKPDILQIKRLLKEIARLAEKIDWGVKREEARTLFEFCFKNFDEESLQDDLSAFFSMHPITECLTVLVEKAIWYDMRILMGYIVQAFKERLTKDQFLENLNTKKGSFTGSIVEHIFVGRYGGALSFNPEMDGRGTAIKCVPQTDSGQEKERSVIEILDALISVYKENDCSKSQKHHLFKVISDSRYAHSLNNEDKLVEAREKILDFYKEIFEKADFWVKHRIKEAVSDKKIKTLSEKTQSIEAIIEKDIWLPRYETLFCDGSWEDNTKKSIQQYVEEIPSKADWATWKEKMTIWLSDAPINTQGVRLFLTLMGKQKPDLIYDDLANNNYSYLNNSRHHLPIFVGYLLQGLLSTSDQNKRDKAHELAQGWVKNNLADSDKVIAVISALGIYGTEIETHFILDELEKIWEEHKEAQNYTFVEALLEGISFVKAVKEGHKKRQRDFFMKGLMGSNDSIIRRLTKDIFFNAFPFSERMRDFLLYDLEHEEEKAAWVWKTFIEKVREIALQYNTYNNENIDSFLQKLLAKGFIEEILEFIKSYADDRRVLRKQGIYKGISEFNILSDLSAEQSDKLLHMFLQWKKEDKNIPFDYICQSTSKSFTDRLVEFVKKEKDAAFSLSLDIIKTMRNHQIDGCDSTLVQNIIMAYSGDITDDQAETLLYCLESI